MQKNIEIRELTGIRFFAAFHVLLFHNYYLIGDWGRSTPAFMKNIFSFGDSAVAFFFILSGFILSYVYITPDKKLKTSKFDFIWARISRLYPVYILALLMDLPRGLDYFLEKYDFSTAVTKIVISLSAYISMLQSWHPRLTPAWNSPAWSLSVEAFFYILFPFLVMLIFKLKSCFRILLSFYLIPIIIFFLLRNGMNFDFEDASNAVLWRSLPILRLSEFIIGMIIGKIFLQKKELVSWFKNNTKLSSLIFWGSLFLSLICVSFQHKLPREIVMNVFLVPCFSIMIFSLACCQIRLTSIFRNNVFVLLGSASFTLYIIHQPVLFYFNKFNLEKGPLYFFLYAITTIILSIFIYLKFEIPMQKIIRRNNPFKSNS